MDKRVPTVLFISSYSVAFVLRDIEILKKHFNLLVANFVGIKKTFYDTVVTIITIWKKLRKSDLSFIWFADLRALITIVLSKLLQKPTILVVGGYEVANVPEIYYGGALRRFSRKKISFIIRHADVVLSVSRASQHELQKNFSIYSSQLVYNGIEIDKFIIDAPLDKEDIAITVGRVTESNLLRKGIEPFVRAAAFLPKVSFYVIGKYDNDAYEQLKNITSDNVTFTGFIAEKELIEFYQRAKVYVQVSAHEGFGISLAEAMLAECIPVVTDRGALPEVVGDSGYTVDFNDPCQTARAIESAMHSTNGYTARKHIIENFSMKRRENALQRIINSLCR